MMHPNRMMHPERVWRAVSLRTTHELAAKLTDEMFVLCIGFALFDLVFVNDSMDETPRWAVLRAVPGDQYEQLTTFTRCSEEQAALSLINLLLARGLDERMGTFRLNITTAGRHSCSLCA